VDGDELFKWKDTGGDKVLDEKITATISNVLSDDSARAYVFGAGSVLTLPDRPVAAKTGTTNNYVDAWTVGYTPSLVAGVWVGNTDNHPMKKGDGGSRLAAPIWNKFMTAALQGMPVENFSDLPPNDADKPILRGSTGGGITLKINSLNGLIATSSTPPGVIVERTYVPAHSILHYVNKDDPRGPAPEHPELDPQYSIWEAAITDWVKRSQASNPGWSISFTEPPTQYDNTESTGLSPSLEIMSPTAGSVLINRDLVVDVRASSPRGVTKITYKIDERTVGVIKTSPFTLHYHAYDLVNGTHQFTIIAEDDIGNQVVKQLPFTLQAAEDYPAVYFEDQQINLQPTQFPRTFSLAHYKLEQISEVSIYKQSNQSKILLYTSSDFKNLFDNKILFKWNEVPALGSYQLVVEVKLKDGSVRESGRVSVVIE
jgi:membrane carboxypeptidase/penicillin-binding protein PbpC